MIRAQLSIALTCVACSRAESVEPVASSVPVPSATAAVTPPSCVVATRGSAVGRLGARWPRLAVDGRGRGIATWLGEGGVESEIAEELEPGRWELRRPARSLPGSGTKPDLAAGSDGSAVVAWRQSKGEDGVILVSERGADGAWRDPRGLDDALSLPPRAYEPRAVIGDDGEQLLVWNQWYGTHYGVALARRAGPGLHWQRPSRADEVLSPARFFANSPQISLGKDGRAVVTWFQSLGGPLAVLYSERSSARGTFARATTLDVLSASGGAVDENPFRNPTPAVGPHGEAAIVWTQEDEAKGVAVYLAFRDPAGRWQRPSSLADHISPAGGQDRDASLGFGPNGDLFVVWSHSPGGNDPGVWLAHRAARGPFEPAIRLTEPGVSGWSPVMAVASDDSVRIVWSEKLDARWRIVMRRKRPGQVSWGPMQIVSAPASGSATSPAIASGGSPPRTLVTWVEGQKSFEGQIAFAACE